MQTYKVKFEARGWSQIGAVSLYAAYQHARKAEWFFGPILYIGRA